MRLGSIVSIAVTIGVVLGAVGVMAYDLVHFILGHYDDD